MALATGDVDEPADDGFGAPVVPTHRIGSVVGGAYRLVRQIGSGGSSHVFEGEHVRLGRRFAVKVLRTELDAGRVTAQRFRREARATARLQSEHVVGVVDCGELEDRTPYLVMDLLQGEDLRSLLGREGRLPLRRALPLLLQACRGMSAVHAAGLIHRDLKPENLFVAKCETGEDCCKVLDFGVAKMDATLTTTPGIIVGTVRYMAPEQLVAGATVGPAADVYSLGAILYECLAGRPAHAGETVQQVMYSVLNESREPLGELVPGLPAVLLEAVNRAMHKDSAQRLNSVDELAALLRIAMPRGREQQAEATLPEQGQVKAPVVSVPRRQNRNIALLAACTVLSGTSGWAIGRRAPAPVAAVSTATASASRTLQVTAELPRPVAVPAQPAVPADLSQRVVPADLSQRVVPATLTSMQPVTPLKPAKPSAASSQPLRPAAASPAGVEQLELSNPYGQ